MRVMARDGAWLGWGATDAHCWDACVCVGALGFALQSALAPHICVRSQLASSPGELQARVSGSP